MHVEFLHVQQRLLVEVKSNHLRRPGVGVFAAGIGQEVEDAITVGAEDGVGNKERLGQVVAVDMSRMDLVLLPEKQGIQTAIEPLQGPRDHRPAARRLRARAGFGVDLKVDEPDDAPERRMVMTLLDTKSSGGGGCGEAVGVRLHRGSLES